VLVPMLMNLGNPPGASNTGSAQPAPTGSNGTFLMLGVGTCLSLLVMFLV